jgi:thioesterase domain-containing protein
MFEDSTSIGRLALLKPAPSTPKSADAACMPLPLRERPGPARLSITRRGPCILIIPGMGGKVDGVRELGRRLRTSLPVYALEGRGLDGSCPPDTAVDAIVVDALERLHSLQPEGPYFLCGHSFGGLIAFEMARRLQAADQTIAGLFLLDTTQPKRNWSIRYLMAFYVDALAKHSRALLRLPLSAKYRHLQGLLTRFWARIHDPYGVGDKPIDVMAGSQIAFQQYRPGPYPGKMTFFRATASEIAADPEFLWRKWVGQLETHAVQGGHNTMLELPHVAGLAETISVCLAEAGAVVA